MCDQSKLKPFEQVLPVLKHAVFDQEDIDHGHPGRASLTPRACERLADAKYTGFEAAAMKKCCEELFEYQDLSDRYRDPSNLDAEELDVFGQLRNVLKGCLVFDPFRRYSSHQALEMLTGRLHHYESMPAQVLEQIKLVELAVQDMDPVSMERQRRFISDSPLDGQPTSASIFLASAP